METITYTLSVPLIIAFAISRFVKGIGTTNYFALLALGLFFVPNLVVGQNLEDEQQEIIKDFEAQLEDAQRVIVKPLLQPAVVSKKTYKYDITIIPLELKYPDPVIKPLAAEPDLLFESKSFYAKLGYGNLQNPKAIIKYYKTDENKFDYFVDLNFYGLNNSDKVENQQMSNTDLKLGFNYRIKENLQLNVKAKAIYDMRKAYFIYGDDDMHAYKGKPVNKFQLGGQAEIFNPEATASGLDYNAQFGYTYVNLKSYTDKGELNPYIGLSLSKALGDWKLTFPAKACATFQNGISDLYTFTFNPSIKTSSEKFWLKAGLSFFNDSELKSKIWPEIHADYTLSGKSLHIFVATEQKSIVNNLTQLTVINPWVFPNLQELTNNVMQTISGGIKSESHFLGLEAEGGYAKSFNQISFVNSILSEDDLSHAIPQNVNAVFIKANVDFALSSKISLGGNLIKNFYTEDVYGIPSLELKSYAKLNLVKDIFVLRPSLTIRDRSKVLLDRAIPEEIVLNNQVDLSAGGEFNISDKFALYLEANNVLNNLYRPLYGYPVVGIHFNGGVVVRL